jgi:hypothetical protein
MDQNQSLPQPGAKTISGQIVEDCRPEKQHQRNPEIFSALVAELPQVNILQDYEHQTDVDDKSQQRQGKQTVRLTKLGKTYQADDESCGKNNCQQRVNLLKIIHKNLFGEMAAITLGQKKSG